MRVTFEGWSRNHGRHTVVNEALEDTRISDTSPSPSFDKGKLYIHYDEEKNVSYVLYAKGVSVRLSGDYQLRITLTPSDALLIAYLCFQNLGMAAFAKAFATLSEVGEKLSGARKTLANGYSNWQQHLPRIPRLPSPPQH